MDEEFEIGKDFKPTEEPVPEEINEKETIMDKSFVEELLEFEEESVSVKEEPRDNNVEETVPKHKKDETSVYAITIISIVTAIIILVIITIVLVLMALGNMREASEQTAIVIDETTMQAVETLAYNLRKT
ncbi:MAG: hypothetical protein FWC79_07325 [Oscillospiraceae bacterium]|nr:hypothetical protein [Oscillospiraceae bacterium]